ncbi:MAG: 50S ribosomal protein L11 methyltransferase, partial [Clostridiales bacterium]|nr:50S ribosomal protein L11 methyltransferase [Clostridiales bacterium]
MKFIEITTKTTTLGAEMVSAIYDAHGATGCVIEDKNDIINNLSTYGEWDYIADDVIGDMPDEVQIKAYFDMQAESTIIQVKKDIANLITFTDMDLGSLEVIVNVVDEDDWKNEWKKLLAIIAVFVGCFYLPVG